MRASKNQIDRIGQLAYQLRVPIPLLTERTRTARLDDLDEPTASDVIRCLGEIAAHGVPESPQKASVAFCDLWGPPRSQASARLRPPTDGEDWFAFAVDILDLNGEQECSCCGGRGRVAVRLTKRLVIETLIGPKRSQFTPKAAVSQVRNLPVGQLRRLADSHFAGDLNAAARFCDLVAPLMEAG